MKQNRVYNNILRRKWYTWCLSSEIQKKREQPCSSKKEIALCGYIEFANLIPKQTKTFYQCIHFYVVYSIHITKT